MAKIEAINRLPRQDFFAAGKYFLVSESWLLQTAGRHFLCNLSFTDINQFARCSVRGSRALLKTVNLSARNPINTGTAPDWGAACSAPYRMGA